MKKLRLILIGVLLCAAPLFCQKTDPTSFQLTETRAEVAKLLGPPKMVAAFGTDFESWQYQIGETEEEGFSHQLVFRKSTGRLISIAINFTPERKVDEWFPEPETAAHFDKSGFAVRLRKLSGGRVLLAMGVSKPGQPTGQIFLIRETEIAAFLPWLVSSVTNSR